MFERTKKLCDAFVEMGVPGIDLAVYKDGECVLRYMSGYSDVENKVLLKGDERYNIYSCSKPITCVAALQLWEKGLFSLEDKLSDYMPEFENMNIKTKDGVEKAKKPILIKHLFTMSAGFDYYLNTKNILQCKEDTSGKCPTRELMKYLAKDPLEFEPGSFWRYGLSHDVLAALIEVISGQKFEDYVKENIFEPLGMSNSSFLLKEDEIETVSCQYRYNWKEHNVALCGKDIQTFKLGTEYASGGAGCISTVDDYIKFLEALRIGNKIIKKETIEMMATDMLTDAQREVYWKKDSHGYGLGVRTPKKGGIYTDFGWDGAAGAFLAVDIPNGVSIFSAQHVLSSSNDEVRGWVYPFVMAELFEDPKYIKLINESEVLKNYNITF